MSINYSINQEIDLDGKHSNNKFHSRGEVITINKSENPIFGEEIAKETGIAASTINNLCNNKTTRIDFHTIELICDTLNCNLSDIFQIK